MKENIIIYCPNCGMKHRIKFLNNERFDVEFKCPCGGIVKFKSDFCPNCGRKMDVK